MITAQFILFFFAFLIICMFVMGALNRDLRDKRYLSTMGCLLSVMLIVCVCFFPFPYQDELLQTMITIVWTQERDTIRRIQNGSTN